MKDTRDSTSPAHPYPENAAKAESAREGYARQHTQEPPGKYQRKNPRSGERRKRLLPVLAVVAVMALPVSYGVFWHIVADRIAAWIEGEWDEAAAGGFVIHGDLPSVSGFPGTPVVRFSGRIETGHATLVVPDLSVRSFFIQGWPLVLTLPEGLHLERDDPRFDGEIWSLQYAALSGPIPRRLPAAPEERALRAWRDKGGAIEIERFSLRKDALDIEGSGRVWLDDALQPEGILGATVAGYGEFMTFLQQKNLIAARQSFLIGAVLNGLAVTDPGTGRRVLAGELTLKNRRLAMGPVTLMTLPHMDWPRAPESVKARKNRAPMTKGAPVEDQSGGNPMMDGIGPIRERDAGAPY